MLWAELVKAWANENGYVKPGAGTSFMEKVRGCDVEEFKPKGGSWSYGVQLIDPETWEDDRHGARPGLSCRQFWGWMAVGSSGG